MNSQADMAWATSPDLPRTIPPRPALPSHQSSSLPSTPYQHPRDLTFHPGSPDERETLTGSPRSIHSESNHTLPALRKQGNGCKYETGLAFAKRRFQYSLGTDKLPTERPPKEHLTVDEDVRLSEELKVLCQSLLPTDDSERRRALLVSKLEQLLNKQWPGHSIKVNVFGSTGNKLGTRESDVDICITTDFKELGNVCILAETLAENGMERVVCVSSAKVPIVKIWDPVLQLACDLNVNNPVALENTQMIRTYVDIDARVRPLALVIKHWTRRRLLNDAALGATLSSYTWICMIINFLQTRRPPILPALQQAPNLPQKVMDGLNVSYEKDIERLREFGKQNKESVGELFFQFFKYYGYEVDYDATFVSVREGKLADKRTQPGWQINRLCVQEPFNFSRNLANTADDTSFRGIHFELRRACGELGKGDLQSCCGQYTHPPEEPRTIGTRAFSNHPRPIPTNPASHFAKNHRGGVALRGGRQGNFQNRMTNGLGRRASSASNRGQPYRPSIYTMTPQEAHLQQQQQQQMLHDHLFHQYQILQAQEQELRMQLQQQANAQARGQPPIAWPQLQFPAYSSTESAHDETLRARAGTVNHPPLTAPLRQNGFIYTSPSLLNSVPAPQGTSTNPPSPLLNSNGLDLRRNRRRSSLTNGSSGGSLRAHSQPPRAGPPPLSMQAVPPYQWALGDLPPHLHPRARPMPSPASLQRELEANSYFPRSPLAYPDQDRRRATEYLGYYVGPLAQAQSQAQSRYAYPMAYANQPGMALRSAAAPHTRLSDNSAPLTSPSSPIMKTNPQRPLASHSRDHSSSPIARPQTALRVNGGPLIVDGSRGASKSQHRADDDGEEGGALSYSTSTSDEVPINTPSSSEDSSDGRAIVPMAELEPAPPSSTKDHDDENKIPRQTNGLGVKYPFSNYARKPAPGNHSSVRLHYSQGDPTIGLGIGKIANVSDDPLILTHHRGRSRTKSGDFYDNVNSHTLGTPVSDAKDRTPTPSSNGRQITPNVSMVAESNGIGHGITQFNVTNAEVLEGSKLRAAVTTNGGTVGALGSASPNHPGSTNGWQTQLKKKHKKGTKSTNNPLGGQSLPVDSTQRKGG